MKQNKFGVVLFYLFNILLYSLCANCWYLIWGTGKWHLIPVFFTVFLLVNILPVLPNRCIPNFKLKICRHGVACLRIFRWSCSISVLFHIIAAIYILPGQWGTWIISLLLCACALFVIFWNGMISVYAASVQLGVHHRLTGLLCGMIPIVNLVMLRKIIRTVSAEVEFETEKARLNAARKDTQICHTKYPILLVHGVFFRDFEHLNYWGRIPAELIRNGAQIFYGNHHSASSVACSAEELTERIKTIVTETGCGKVNIIAHSKGGLDCRYAICCGGAAPYVASITTINTPHRGCEFAEYLLKKAPQHVQQRISATYNAALKKLGDSNPDFMAAVRDLTVNNCRMLNQLMEDTANTQNIFCQSIGSKLNHATNGKFPLNFTFPLVKYFDGSNDGLVSEKSFSWGESYQFLTAKGKRGISHGDMIDLNRENLPEFDVREFYVRLLADLKKRGL